MGHTERLGMENKKTWAQTGLLLIDQEVVEELRILTFWQMAWQANGECFRPSLCVIHFEHQHDLQTQHQDHPQPHLCQALCYYLGGCVSR